MKLWPNILWQVGYWFHLTARLCYRPLGGADQLALYQKMLTFLCSLNMESFTILSGSAQSWLLSMLIRWTSTLFKVLAIIGKQIKQVPAWKTREKYMCWRGCTTIFVSGRWIRMLAWSIPWWHRLMLLLRVIIETFWRGLLIEFVLLFLASSRRIYFVLYPLNI